MLGHFHVRHRDCRAETDEDAERLIALSTYVMNISVVWKCLIPSSCELMPPARSTFKKCHQICNTMFQKLNHVES